MDKALIIIKSPGIGDLQILLSNIHHLAKEIGRPVTILAQKNTGAKAVFSYDKLHVDEVIDLGKRDFFNIINKIKSQKFNQVYIYSDSIRLYLIARLSGISKIYHYPFFSKKGKNFYKTAKEFTEEILKIKIDPQSKLYCDEQNIEKIKIKFNITKEKKNIVCGISASGPTKRWNINNYIKLFEKINSKYSCNFFLAGGKQDEDLIKNIKESSIGKNCSSLSKMTISEAMPIIASSQYYIGNDTGWGHISSGLGLKSLFLFMDSPPSAYGLYSRNISIIVPNGETIESCSHNTRGKDRIPTNKVLDKMLELIN